MWFQKPWKPNLNNSALAYMCNQNKKISLKVTGLNCN